ncbi:MAG: hypothetical protein AAF203_02265 [Pseudomonadota bacterium]
MKFSLIILVLALPLSVFGKNMEIDSKIYFKGQKVGSPRLYTKNGTKARVVMRDARKREYSLEMVPKILADKTIKVSYKLAIKEKKNETITRGSILVDPSQNGRVSIDKGAVELFLKVKNT